MAEPSKFVRRRVTHPEGGEMRTKQADKASADINVIVSRWMKTGVVSQANGTLQYGDFSHGLDFHTAANRLLDAERSFDALPAAVRKHCRNDPGLFLDMVMDPERRPELVELGLVEALVPEVALPAPDVVPPAEPPADPPPAG